MINIKAIVAVDKNWGIGRNNKLLAHLPSDLQRFKAITEGNIVVMGRKTLESLPNGNPLPNRINIVITRDKLFSKEGVIAVNSIEHLSNYMRILEVVDDVDCYVIGGGQIFERLLEFCNEVLITKINHKFEVDTYFPNLDKSKEWEIADESEPQYENGYEFTYITYKRKED